MMNKSKGNMYTFVTHTWNAIKGKCPHNCDYCYCKRFPQPKLHFDEKELKTNLGNGNFIFVGSSCDMWAEDINDYAINKILEHCKKYDNTYLFQSKNPRRFVIWRNNFPRLGLIGTTIETNREGYSYDAPTVEERVRWMSDACKQLNRRFIGIELSPEYCEIANRRLFQEVLI